MGKSILSCLLDGEIPVKTGFSKALDLDQSVTETRSRSLHHEVDSLMQPISDLVAENGDAATLVG